MLPGERLVALVFLLIISFLIDAIIFYVLGYKAGRKDEGEEWAEKKEYYEWLLEMKKRQDFEEVKIVPKKPVKPKKEKLHCDICGKVIKSGTLCYDCKKAGW